LQFFVVQLLQGWMTLRQDVHRAALQVADTSSEALQAAQAMVLRSTMGAYSLSLNVGMSVRTGSGRAAFSICDPAL
jgi:hypothetical protein